MKEYDCVVIGGGFFGSCLALFLSEYFDKVVLIEKESDLLQRASLNNQARVHMGYHYPRSLVSAFASMNNFPKFVLDFKDAINNDFTKIYGIAKSGSKVTAKQFFEIYKRLGAPIKIAHPSIKLLFNINMVEEIFEVKEYAFDAVVLKEIIKEKFKKSSVEIMLNTTAKSVSKSAEKIHTHLENNEILSSKFIFNTTYAGINTLLYNSNLPLLDLKHEITEMVLISPPRELVNLSFTIMDGSFFSLMPYPSCDLYTLSHVRFTPHGAWIDKIEYKNPYKTLQIYSKNSNFTYMIKDAARFIPLILESKYHKSLFEIKTLQVKNERDDARPILFAPNYHIKGFSNIMGGKIDNIYEILSVLKEMKDFLGIKKRSIWNIFS